MQCIWEGLGHVQGAGGDRDLETGRGACNGDRDLEVTDTWERTSRVGLGSTHTEE